MPTDSEKIFFSYARKDSEFVLKLAQELRAAGADLWLDKLDIPAGQRWDRAIQKAMNACPRMLVVLSPASEASDNVLDEVSYALRKRKLVIPILYQDCEIPFRLDRLQYVDFTVDYERGFAQLLKELGITQPLEATPPSEHEVPVTYEWIEPEQRKGTPETAAELYDWEPPTQTPLRRATAKAEPQRLWSKETSMASFLVILGVLILTWGGVWLYIGGGILLIGLIIELVLLKRAGQKRRTAETPFNVVGFERHKLILANAQHVGQQAEQQDAFGFSNPQDTAFVETHGLLVQRTVAKGHSQQGNITVIIMAYE